MDDYHVGVATDELDLVAWLFASPALRLGIVGRAAARSANEAVAAVGLKPRSEQLAQLLVQIRPGAGAAEDDCETEPADSC